MTRRSTRARPAPIASANLTPDTKITALAKHPILDSLSGPQLVVYLRLIAATGAQGRRVRVINLELYRDARTAVSALHSLEEMGLIKITHDGGLLRRQIEVRS